MSAYNPKRTFTDQSGPSGALGWVDTMAVRKLGEPMRRREFISLLSAAVVSWPLVARAQHPSTRIFRIGFLGLPTADSLPERPEAFRAGLRELGYREGRDFVIEYRWADGKYKQLPALLDDLIRLKVDVIVTHGTPGVLAAKKATTTIPIVCAVVGDALASGVVSSLARPGGNVTGLTFFNPELAAKRLELLKEVLTELAEVGIFFNLSNPHNRPVTAPKEQIRPAVKVGAPPIRRPSPRRFRSGFCGDVNSAYRRARGHRRCDADFQYFSGGRARFEAASTFVRVARFRCRRRRDGLWSGLSRHVPARRYVRGQDYKGREAGRSAHRAGDQV